MVVLHAQSFGMKVTSSLGHVHVAVRSRRNSPFNHQHFIKSNPVVAPPSTTKPYTRISSSRYSDLLTGSQEAQQKMHWSRATVIENKTASADGSLRTLVLSVDDAVIYGDGRKVKHIRDNKRWLDSYFTPGQFVAIRYHNGGGSLEENNRNEAVVANHLLALASSPYEARSTSAALDAAIVDILVDRNGGKDEAALAELPPGAVFEVSEVLGRGFSSLFNSEVGLQSSLEEGRPLLMICVGSRGIAPLRAALSWTPVLAHATAHPCNLIYAADSQASAAYLLEWDSWRDAGVNVSTLYVGNSNNGKMSSNGGSSGVSTHALALGEALEIALFGGERGLVGALSGGDPMEAAVVMSGVPGDVAAHLTRRLTHGGVQRPENHNTAKKRGEFDLSAMLITLPQAPFAALKTQSLRSHQSYKSLKIHAPVQTQSLRPSRSHKSLKIHATASPELIPHKAAEPIPTRQNTIPHPREMRRFFYTDTCNAVADALNDGLTRISIRCTIPELNTNFDVYRIGTLLEMIREIATVVAKDGKRVKVCVQQPLGQGVFAGIPLSLNGVMRILKQMDWGSASEFITLGNLGKEEVEKGDADAFVLISPQNIQGHSVVPLLEEMTTAVEGKNIPIIIVNAKLGDVPSSAGIMGVRGRQERMDFTDTFIQAYHFRLLLLNQNMPYPIMGALRYTHGGPWEIFKRFDLIDESTNLRYEQYHLLERFDGEREPDAGQITEAFQRKRPS